MGTTSRPGSVRTKGNREERKGVLTRTTCRPPARRASWRASARPRTACPRPPPRAWYSTHGPSISARTHVVPVTAALGQRPTVALGEVHRVVLLHPGAVAVAGRV